MLQGKKILLGISGGIAAYKAVEVASRLRKLGGSVHVVMTAAATRLVAPLTFQAVTANAVHVDLLAEPKRWHVEHIGLAEQADLYLIAPATANVVAKLAQGLADDFVTVLALAVTCPLLVCPAMETHMYAHPAVQDNLQRLGRYGYRVMEPGEGHLASGQSGRGRLPEPVEIVAAALGLLVSPAAARAYLAQVAEEALAVIRRAEVGSGAAAERAQDLAGRRVVVTAGATREPLDPVRFITNRSSGKMGYALALAAASRGATVELISGPVSLPPPPGVRLTAVESAAEMLAATMAAAKTADVIIGAAAVADYTPRECAEQKIKKEATGAALILELVKTADVIGEVGRTKRPGQVVIGFAAETQQLLEHAREKIARKHLDGIVANDVTRAGAGFAVDTNQVTLLDADDNSAELPLLPKDEVAHRIWDWVVQRFLGGPSA